MEKKKIWKQLSVIFKYNNMYEFVKSIQLELVLETREIKTLYP